jgi:cyclase
VPCLDVREGRVVKGVRFRDHVDAGAIEELALRYAQEGADKVSVNSPALRRPALVAELAEAFGSQCVVVGIDSERDADGDWRVRRDSGDPARMQALPLRTLDWIERVQALGAGEIVLNCMGSDGVRSGYDIEQLRAARAACALPLVASGGAGAAAHFAEVLEQADVDAALAASIFHSGALGIGELKQDLRSRGLEVRP